MIKIFVISLETALERRQHIFNQLNQLNLDFEFFNALRGDQNIQSNKNYDYLFRERLFGRQMTAGEIGCFRSHQELWKIAVELNQTLCIMEDDVTLSPNFGEILNKLETYTNYDILRMSGIFLRKHYLWAIYNEIHLVKYWRDPMGTQCYLVNPRSAKRLLEKSTLIQVPVDDFIGDYALHKLNVVGCKNYPVLHDISIPSQLGNRHKKKYFTLAGKVYRELYLQTRNIKKLLVQVSFFILAQLRNKNAN